MSGIGNDVRAMGDAKLEALVDTFADPKKLVRIEAGDHFFEGRLKEVREAIERWASELLAAQP